MNDWDVAELARRLSDPANAVPPSTFPRDPREADHAGLYSWWADEVGSTVLGLPFGLTLPSLIYAGQAGATTRHSRAERVATLRSRIGGNHLNGNIGSSTFRKTLTAVLWHPLGLCLAGPNRLDRESNRRVSTWMRDHLRVAIAPVDRGALAAIEHAVLQVLDPPLNLMGMSSTAVRTKLHLLRASLKPAWEIREADGPP